MTDESGNVLFSASTKFDLKIATSDRWAVDRCVIEAHFLDASAEVFIDGEWRCVADVDHIPADAAIRFPQK